MAHNFPPEQEQMDLIELLPLIREVTEKGGTFRLYPMGRSMLPTIQPGRDSVLLAALDKVHRGDAVLYRRKSGQFVLHRIIHIDPKTGLMTMRGDNQFYKEPGIAKEQLIAKVTAIYRGEKKLDCNSAKHKAYLAFRSCTYFPRHCIAALHTRLARFCGRKK